MPRVQIQGTQTFLDFPEGTPTEVMSAAVRRFTAEQGGQPVSQQPGGQDDLSVGDINSPVSQQLTPEQQTAQARVGGPAPAPADEGGIESEIQALGGEGGMGLTELVTGQPAPPPKTVASEKPKGLIRRGLAQVGGSINEQAQQGARLIVQTFNEEHITPYQETLGVLKVALGGLALATSPLAPIIQGLANVGRTAVSGIEAGIGATLTDLPPDSETFLRASDNVSKMFTLAGDDRATTGSEVGDLVTDLMFGLVPVEWGLLIGLRASKAALLGGKAESIGRVTIDLAHGLSPRAAKKVGAVMEAIPEERYAQKLLTAGDGGPITDPARLLGSGGLEQLGPAGRGGVRLTGGVTASRAGGLPPKRIVDIVPDVRTVDGKIISNQVQPPPTITGGAADLGERAIQAIPPGTVQRAERSQRLFESTVPESVLRGPRQEFPTAPTRILEGPGRPDRVFPPTVTETVQRNSGFRTDAIRANRLRQEAAEVAQRNIDDAMAINSAQVEASRARQLERSRGLGEVRGIRPIRQVPVQRRPSKVQPGVLFSREADASISSLGINTAKLPVVEDASMLKRLYHNTFSLRGAAIVDFTSAGVVTRKQGQFGKMFMDLIDSVDNVFEKRASGALADLFEVTGRFGRKKFRMSQGEKNLIFSALNHGDDQAAARAVTMSQQASAKEIAKGKLFLNVEEAQAELNRLAPEIGGLRTRLHDMGLEAADYGMKVRRRNGSLVPFDLRENFMPHFIKDGIFKDQKFTNRLEKWIVENHPELATNRFEANVVLQDYVRHHSAPRFGNMEKARELNLPDWAIKTDLEAVLSTYYTRGYRRLEEVRTLGQNNEIINPLIQGMRAEGYNAQFAEDLLAATTGTVQYSQGRANLSKFLRTVNTPLLASAQVINLSQSVSTLLRTNTRATLKAMFQLSTNFRKESEFGLRSSALMDNFTGEIMRQMGGFDAGGQFLRATGFSFTERINRTISAVAGRNYAQQTFKRISDQVKRGQVPNKRAVKELERLGINVDEAIKRGGLKQDDLFSAAQQITNDTQFRTRAKDLPLWWNSPEGKVVNQFGQFAFKQTQLIKNEVAKKLFTDPVQGLKNLTKLGIAFPIAGEIFGRGRRAIREAGSAGLSQIIGTDPIEFPEVDENLLAAVKKTGVDNPEMITRIVEDAIMVGALGKFMDVWQATQYGTLSQVSAILGPSVPLAVAPLEAVARGEIKPISKEVQRRIPFLAPIIVGPTKTKKKEF